MTSAYTVEVDGFQSAPLIRGETFLSPSGVSSVAFQSAPLIRGETEIPKGVYGRAGTFQSAPLIRGETLTACIALSKSCSISIRSPHTRGDPLVDNYGNVSDVFNPLPSYEGRPPERHIGSNPDTFSSAPLIRGETPA